MEIMKKHIFRHIISALCLLTTLAACKKENTVTTLDNTAWRDQENKEAIVFKTDGKAYIFTGHEDKNTGTHMYYALYETNGSDIKIKRYLDNGYHTTAEGKVNGDRIDAIGENGIEYHYVKETY